MEQIKAFLAQVWAWIKTTSLQIYNIVKPYVISAYEAVKAFVMDLMNFKFSDDFKTFLTSKTAQIVYVVVGGAVVFGVFFGWLFSGDSGTKIPVKEVPRVERESEPVKEPTFGRHDTNEELPKEPTEKEARCFRILKYYDQKYWRDKTLGQLIDNERKFLEDVRRCKRLLGR